MIAIQAAGSAGVNLANIVQLLSSIKQAQEVGQVGQTKVDKCLEDVANALKDPESANPAHVASSVDALLDAVNTDAADPSVIKALFAQLADMLGNSAGTSDSSTQGVSGSSSKSEASPKGSKATQSVADKAKAKWAEEKITQLLSGGIESLGELALILDTLDMAGGLISADMMNKIKDGLVDFVTKIASNCTSPEELSGVIQSIQAGVRTDNPLSSFISELSQNPEVLAAIGTNKDAGTVGAVLTDIAVSKIDSSRSSSAASSSYPSKPGPESVGAPTQNDASTVSKFTLQFLDRITQVISLSPENLAKVSEISSIAADTIKKHASQSNSGTNALLNEHSDAHAVSSAPLTANAIQSPKDIMHADLLGQQSSKGKPISPDSPKTIQLESLQSMSAKALKNLSSGAKGAPKPVQPSKEPSSVQIAMASTLREKKFLKVQGSESGGMADLTKKPKDLKRALSDAFSNDPSGVAGALYGLLFGIAFSRLEDLMQEIAL